MLPLPPLALKTTVLFGSGVHCAYKVVAAANVAEAPSEYETPEPSEIVFQFEKLYPGRVMEFEVSVIPLALVIF